VLCFNIIKQFNFFRSNPGRGRQEDLEGEGGEAVEEDAGDDPVDLSPIS
jgi:hypothetical protein